MAKTVELPPHIQDELDDKELDKILTPLEAQQNKDKAILIAQAMRLILGAASLAVFAIILLISGGLK